MMRWSCQRLHGCVPVHASATSKRSASSASCDLREAQSLAALAYAVTARYAWALDEGEPVQLLPNRLLEENLWRAIRHGLSGGFIDLEHGEVVPARARIEALVEWALPAAEELGVGSLLNVPEANSAERQYARLAELGSHRDVFLELVRPRERVA